ncbi:MAG TPA: sulfatase-like hydrolase/transferase, partial [Gammaproteobacteria bacterium]|nr:sulfatase-like hydrolase/transferase [Gammaproteobacteria bacterium]
MLNTLIKYLCIVCFMLFSLAEICFANPKVPPYNIIFIIIDQETHQLLNAQNYELTARKALAEHGISFQNHYTAAAMCSPSRATLLTGVPPQIHKVFDQMEYAFVPELSASRPNMGSVLKSLGYRTAYFGKFEMNKKLLIDVKNTINYSTLAQSYGFDIFNPDGDVGGQPRQGYHEDIYYTGEAIRWLRQNVGKSTKPFFMVVSLLNPHDIMYGDANLPGTPQIQKAGVPVIFPPPDNAIYKTRWKFTLPNNLNESLVKDGMPAGLWEYQQGWSGALGSIPTQRKDMWEYYYNYYLNALGDSDRSLQNIVDAIQEMNLWENTIVILTADHGEMGGAHGGLRGKGPMAYEENAHIPLIIDHPKAPKGILLNMLTSHMDLLPTLMGLTGLSPNQLAKAKVSLKGHDFSEFVLHPEKDDLHAV